MHDIEKLVQFLDYKKYDTSPKNIELKHLQEFLKWINELGMSAHTSPFDKRDTEFLQIPVA